MTDEMLSLKQIYDNHPIAQLNDKHKRLYLRGLGDLLCHLGHQNKMARRLYDNLCCNILGCAYPEGWLNSNKMGNARKAQGLCREGFKFFRMNESFWWDFYRIAFLSRISLNTFSDKKIKKGCVTKSKCFHDEARFFYCAPETSNESHSSYIEELKSEYSFQIRPQKVILVVGTMSAGKSTLINTLVGEKVAKVKTTACTAKVTSICNRPLNEGVYYMGNGKVLKFENGDPSQLDSDIISLHFKGGVSSLPIILRDTPGVDYAYDASHREQTEKEIKDENYDSIICVVNAPYLERSGEWDIINSVLSIKNKKNIIILNQLDRFDPEDDSIEEGIKQFRRILKSKKSIATIVPLSARTAFLLKKEMTNSLSNLEQRELTTLKAKLSSPFYDLGKYATDVSSKDDDFFARSGLTNLETIIANQ